MAESYDSSFTGSHNGAVYPSIDTSSNDLPECTTLSAEAASYKMEQFILRRHRVGNELNLFQTLGSYKLPVPQNAEGFREEGDIAKDLQKEGSYCSGNLPDVISSTSSTSDVSPDIVATENISPEDKPDRDFWDGNMVPSGVSSRKSSAEQKFQIEEKVYDPKNIATENISPEDKSDRDFWDGNMVPSGVSSRKSSAEQKFQIEEKVHDPKNIATENISPEDKSDRDFRDGNMVPSGVSSRKSSAEQKFQIEGKVHDPKLSRQVSFNREISICDKTGHCEKKVSLSSVDDDDDDEMFNLKQTTDNQGDVNIRPRLESAEEKRKKYSNRTSDYGTGESSNNSQAESSDQSTISSPEHLMDHSSEHGNQPFLSILKNPSSDTTCVNSPSSSISNSKSPCTSVIEQEKILPLLSILNGSLNGDSFVAPPLEPPLFTKDEGDLNINCSILSNIPDEVTQRLITPSQNEMYNRPPDVEKHALEILDEDLKSRYFSSQKSCPTEPSSSNSGRSILSVNSSSKFDFAQMKDELISQHNEDTLFRMDPRQSAGDFDNIIQNCRMAGSASSPSPNSPLTPKALARELGILSYTEKERTFSFKTFQGLNLTPEGKVIQTQMVKASQCDYRLCNDLDCMKGKQILKTLNESLELKLFCETYHYHKEKLLALFDHSMTCDEMKCSLPWCTFLNWKFNLASQQNWENIEPRSIAKELTEFVQLPTLRFTDGQDPSQTLLKLSSRFPQNQVREVTDFITLIRMGKKGNAVMATQLTTMDYWIIKKIHLSHSDDDTRLEVFQRLKDHTCSHIVTFLWMKQASKLLHVCSLLELGGNLHDVLQAHGPFPKDKALFYLKQIIEAAIFLHQKEILYLLWEVKNVVLSDQGVAKLCNFSAAVCISEQYDIEDVSDLIPATLLSPELVSGSGPLCEGVDSWGIGCILTELLTAKSTRQDVIHKDRTTILQEIAQSPIPKIPNVDDKLRAILELCWKIDPAHRKTAVQLKSYL